MGAGAKCIRTKSRRSANRKLGDYCVSGDGPAFHRFGNRVRHCRPDPDAWAAKRRATTTAKADTLPWREPADEPRSLRERNRTNHAERYRARSARGNSPRCEMCRYAIQSPP